MARRRPTGESLNSPSKRHRNDRFGNPTFVTGLDYVGSVVVSGSDPFVIHYALGVIGKYTTSGATVNAALVSGSQHPDSVAVSGSKLFVTYYDTNNVGEHTTSGATVNASLTSVPGPVGIAASGSDLFVITGGVVGEYTTSGVTVNASLIQFRLAFPAVDGTATTATVSELSFTGAPPARLPSAHWRRSRWLLKIPRALSSPTIIPTSHGHHQRPQRRHPRRDRHRGGCLARRRRGPFVERGRRIHAHSNRRLPDRRHSAPITAVAPAKSADWTRHRCQWLNVYHVGLTIAVGLVVQGDGKSVIAGTGRARAIKPSASRATTSMEASTLHLEPTA